MTGFETLGEPSWSQDHAGPQARPPALHVRCALEAVDTGHPSELPGSGVCHSFGVPALPNAEALRFGDVQDNLNLGNMFDVERIDAHERERRSQSVEVDQDGPCGTGRNWPMRAE